ncbi:MAG: MBL fold metallo-hydrolase [Chloroflexota bacterium]|nr:MBL fold metallo-hydrolase [Chloroflexota bacterium]
MAYTITVGSIRCHILEDARHLLDGGGFFGLTPRLLWQRVITPKEHNLVPASTRSLLIESDVGLILVDTGWGDKLDAKARQIFGIGDHTDRLVRDMNTVGFQPEDVGIVLLTHLHGDHAGGATRWDTPDQTPGPVVPTFPNARYIAQRLDLADASFPNERTQATYDAANWQPLIERDMLDIVDGPQQLARGVRTEVAPGHTDAIQVLWVEDGGDSLLFLGDACSWAVHLERLAWVPSFDIYPMTSIETKRRLRHEAEKRDALLLFQHDPRIVTGRLKEGERRPLVEPELTEDDAQK